MLYYVTGLLSPSGKKRRSKEVKLVSDKSPLFVSALELITQATELLHYSRTSWRPSGSKRAFFSLVFSAMLDMIGNMQQLALNEQS